MTCDDPGSEPDRASEAATDWFVRLRDRATTAREREDFARWLAADPSHAQAYAEIEGLWSGLDGLSAPLPVMAGEESGRAGRNGRGRRAAGAVAIAVALAVVAPQVRLALSADARSATGEIRRLTLADGSRVVLDGDSAVAADIDADHRRIRLLKGRAWFAVAHEARPFVVAVGKAQIRDIGTAFAVTLRGDGGELAVTQGTVELTAPRGRAMRLTRGQAARFDGNGHGRLVQPASDPLAWQRDRLEFVAVPIGDVLDDLARHGGGRPVMLDGALARHRITGAIDLSRPRAAADAILARSGARAYRLGPWLVVARR
ncbi:FecR family protein [Sphingomonas silueang]|uniref:FecR family protein n=1 Tax=Sphingomonas silueang TaxID=3156617 RepID=UPI0032B374BC